MIQVAPTRGVTKSLFLRKKFESLITTHTHKTRVRTYSHNWTLEATHTQT